MRLRTVIFIAILSLCFASCARSFRTAEQFLDEIEARLETQPDSAFIALDSLDRSLLGTKELRARHALLYTIALEKKDVGAGQVLSVQAFLGLLIRQGSGG